MNKEAELEASLWKSLRADRTAMVALTSPVAGSVAARPMTVLTDGDETPYRGPLYIFTATGNALADAVAAGPQVATAHFASKGHDLFAAIYGRLSLSGDHAVIDRLWNPFVAAWYDGKDDPRLRLLRLDPAEAEIWADANSLIAGIKMLLGIDPKKDYEDKTATIPLGASA